MINKSLPMSAGFGFESTACLCHNPQCAVIGDLIVESTAIGTWQLTWEEL